ncbi:MAG: hypothetical protein NTV58_18560 [Deltaproteobacteria bacterium]|nr:hypothetical protein [Deltaproteobacteria bacterium]
MVSFYQSFTEQKIKTAQAISAGCCEGSYAEGCLILCSVISAMAAIAWPGKNKDNKRFVEIITRYQLSVDPQKVSGPLLVQAGKVCNSKIGISKKAFHLTDKNDLDETIFVKLCPNLKLSEIRRYS